jgi:hypothetical protein
MIVTVLPDGAVVRKSRTGQAGEMSLDAAEALISRALASHEHESLRL